MPKKPAAVAEPPTVDLASIDVGESIQIRWMRVREAVVHQAEQNPKLHDIEALARVFVRDGFTDPPKWDTNLNHGRGGIVYGNGRLEALAWLEGRHREDPEAWPKPRGIGTEQGTGAWVVPVKFGVDALNQVHAQQQLIDHNSLNLAGAGFDPLEVARIYDPEAYLAILNQIEEGAAAAGVDISAGPTATVSRDALASLALLGRSLPDYAEEQGGEGEGEDEGDWPGDEPEVAYQNKYAIAVSCDDEAHQEQVYNALTELGYKCKVLTL